MFQFSNTNIEIATLIDLPNIVGLLNLAYRGDESRAGWTTEADLIQGETRTTITHVTDTYNKEHTVFLIYKNTDVLQGCVNLQLHGSKLYLGMFAVVPRLQGAGIGKSLLHAAEEWAKHNAATSIYMTVISTRTELINWYVRNGYVDTLERIPFEEDGYSGKHNGTLFFSVLEKKVVE